jgi:hypothetical protein
VAGEKAKGKQERDSLPYSKPHFPTETEFSNEPEAQIAPTGECTRFWGVNGFPTIRGYRRWLSHGKGSSATWKIPRTPAQQQRRDPDSHVLAAEKKQGSGSQ